MDAAAIEQDFPGRHPNEPGDHFQGGGLAGTIRPEITGDLARPRRKADVVYGGDSGKSFANVA